MARVPIRQDLLDLIFQSNSHLSNLFGHATWFVQLLFSIILIVSIVALIINITKLIIITGCILFYLLPVSYTHLTLPTTPYV